MQESKIIKKQWKQRNIKTKMYNLVSSIGKKWESFISGDQKVFYTHAANITDLPSDLPYALMFEEKTRDSIRKYSVNDEIRNAVNITKSKNNSIKITTRPPFDLLNYSIGYNGKGIGGNLKLYLKDEMIFNKDAENILTGWNEYQIPISRSDNVTIRWENSIEEDVYLSISKLNETQKKKNIIVIIFDGVIPETIGMYREEPDADNISKFFSSSYSEMFTEAYVQGEWTMPNFASITSSLYQSHHNVCNPDLDSSHLPLNYKTLAEILQENGYNTFGYVGYSRIAPGYGHVRGYNKFFYRSILNNTSYGHRDIIFEALHFLKENQQSNNFIFLHVFDTHLPHFRAPENISDEHDALVNSGVYKIARKKELEEEDFLFIQEIYWQKYREVDNDFSILFDYIKKYENDCTSVIFTADHGVVYFDDENNNIFAIGKKGGRKDYLIKSLVKIPFIIRLPTDKKQKVSVRNDIIEGNIAVMPTVLEIAGIEPPRYIDGISVFRDGKGYAVTESVHKDRYELLLKTNMFKYYLRTNRDRYTGELLKNMLYDEKIFNEDGKMFETMCSKDLVRDRVKDIIADEKLPDIFRND